MSFLMLALATLPTAKAADIVLHDGDPAAATAALATALPDRDASAFELRTVGEWLASKPVTLTAGTVEACEKPPARDWKVAMAAAAVPLDDLEFEAAGPLLEEARSALVCANEPIDGPAAARVDYLLGIVAHFAGDSTASAASFRRALMIDPALAWDPAFPPSARARYEEVSKSLPTARTALAVVPRNVPVRLDGRPVELVGGQLDMPDGTHLVQFGGDKPVTLRLTFDGSSASSVAVPAVVPADAVTWAADPALSSDLARLATLYSPGIPIYAVRGDNVFLGGNNALRFTQVIPPDPRSTNPAAVAVLGAGGLVFVGGAAVAIAGFSMGNKAIDDGESAPSWEEWEAASTRYDGARGLLTAGWIVTLAGAGITAAGGALIAAEPLLVPGGGGLAVRVGGRR